MLSTVIEKEVALAIQAEQQGLANSSQKALILLHGLYLENEQMLGKTLKQSFMLGSATSALGQMAQVELSTMEVALMDKEGKPRLDEINDVQTILNDIIALTAPAPSACH